MTTLVPSAKRRNRLGWFDEDFDDIFEGFFRPMRVFEEAPQRGLAPAVDVSENDNEYIVRAELPGVKKEDINVTLEEGVLAISGETKSETEEQKGGRVIRQERRYGKYMRSLRLGTQVDQHKTKAKYKDGVLELVLPKAESVKPKRIAVDVG
ncbi:MAG: Hsp20/alpha crystallin family protein [Acidiferrobacterales bacterium]|jgi:HSP20 family protein